MKKTLLILAVCTASFSVFSQNLVPSGDFEVGSMDDITGWWSTDNGGKATYALTDEAENVFSGSKALHVNVSEKGANAWDVQRVADNIMDLPEASYGRFSVYVKGTEGASMNFHLQVGGADWIAIWGQKLSTQWQRLSIVGYHSTADAVRIAMHFIEAGDYYVDDISLINSPIAGSVVVPTGDSIIIETGWGINAIDASFDNSSFTLKVNNADVAISKVVNAGAKKFAIIPEKVILEGDSVVIAYDGMGNIAYSSAAGIPDETLVSFSDEVSINTSKLKTSISRVKKNNEIKIYPNPVENELTFIGNESFTKVSIINVAGQQVMSVNQISNNTIAINSLPKGLYIIKAYTNNGALKTSSFIKK